MKNTELQAFSKTRFLQDGHENLLKELRPAFDNLITEFCALPENAGEQQCLKAIEHCFVSINRHENEIETVERETILDAIYPIGAIVGLDESTDYAEQWRGDW
jgi:hypothetical protein